MASSISPAFELNFLKLAEYDSSATTFLGGNQLILHMISGFPAYGSDGATHTPAKDTFALLALLCQKVPDDLYQAIATQLGV